MNKNVFQRIQEWLVVNVVAPIKWKQAEHVDDVDKAVLRELLSSDYFIIATRRSNYLSSFFISLGHWMFFGKWGHYTHVFMNLEDEVEKDSDFRFIEATGLGTHYSTFEEAFKGVNGVALIKPLNMSVEEWTRCLDNAKSHLGKPYDNLFNIKNDLEINCVELVARALQALPNYDVKFKNFDKMLKEKPTITPQLFLDCPDFHVYHTFSPK